jgi:hypothetical protein
MSEILKESKKYQEATQPTDQLLVQGGGQPNTLILSQNDNITKEQNLNNVTPQSDSNVKSQNNEATQSKEHLLTTSKLQSGNITVSQKERMTDKRDRVTFYLNPGQVDKLEELRTEYRKATGKRINEQDLMRKVIDRLTLDILLS